jgi:hypothetical protein
MMTQNQIGSLWVVADEPGWKFGFGGAVLEDPAAAGSPNCRGHCVGAVFGVIIGLLIWQDD